MDCFWNGLDSNISQLLMGEDPSWTLAQYVDIALQKWGSPFTVGEEEEDPFITAMEAASELCVWQVCSTWSGAVQIDQSTAGALESRWLCMLLNRSCGTMMSNTYWSAQHHLKANTPSACLITATEVVPELSTCFVTSTEAITNLGVLSVTVPPVPPCWGSSLLLCWSPSASPWWSPAHPALLWWSPAAPA